MVLEMPLAIHTVSDVVSVLDQRRIEVGGQWWVIEVVGVHRVGADLWVQIACKCRPNESLVLRIASGTTVDDVLHALTWTGPPQQFPRIIRVGSAPAHVVH